MKKYQWARPFLVVSLIILVILFVAVNLSPFTIFHFKTSADLGDHIKVVSYSYPNLGYYCSDFAAVEIFAKDGTLLSVKKYETLIDFFLSKSH
ncbi:hypothetical protein LEP1GSC061_0991 [Leptospira wolffii serovar Khorat str. Khorat-H2]|nr:hypothetical protein LEP1GSC061_0991 [Leptospira wolffii serovar Khorat str. Khorat-H2]